MLIGHGDNYGLGTHMVAGATVAAAIPLVVGATGYAIVKGVNCFFSERQLDSKEHDPQWEIPLGLPAGAP